MSTPQRPLNELLDSRLLVYTLAAGVGLAGSIPSQAEVVFTASNTVMRGPKAYLAIDLDHDGTIDIVLRLTECHSFQYSGYGRVPCMVASGAGPTDQIAEKFNGAEAAGTPLFEAAALPRRALIFASISHSFPFLNYGLMATTSDVEPGQWSGVRDHFLGVRFVNRDTHYGWIGFRSVTATGGLRVELAGWAFESLANRGILAGDRGDNTLAVPVPQSTSLEILSGGHTGIKQRRERNLPGGAQ